MKVKTLEELVNEGALEGKRVFIRADMNVPRDAEGNVTDPFAKYSHALWYFVSYS